MRFQLKFTAEAEKTLQDLSKQDARKHRKVLKTLGLMEVDLRHPSLKTYKFSSLEGPDGAEVFES